MKFEFPSNLPDDPNELEQFVSARENDVDCLKPDTRARIVWADPDGKTRTSCSVVYLHGFTASQGEGYPTHLDFARRYGFNLYLSRLKGHGIDHPDAFTGLTPQHFIDSAAEAMAIGTRLGSEVILMGTSTGASLALYLASKAGREEFLRGLILYSPLIEFYGIKSRLLSNRWSRSVLKLVPGNSYMMKTNIDNPRQKQVWYQKYRMEGALALGALVEKTMTVRTFKNVTLPAFVGYYYKSKTLQDQTVSVEAIKQMFDSLGTAPEKRRLVNFPDAGTHVICSSLLSNSVKQVEKQTFQFSENVLALNSLNETDSTTI